MCNILKTLSLHRKHRKKKTSMSLCETHRETGWHSCQLKRIIGTQLVWFHSTSCVPALRTQTNRCQTHRHFGFDHVVHLDVQVLYFYLHALSSLHCCCRSELWLLQLWETGGGRRYGGWGEGQTLAGQDQGSILDLQRIEDLSSCA